MCIAPITINTDKSKAFTEYTNIVPCGKCIECLRSRQNSWAFRLNEELKRSDSATFLTLTSDDDNIKFSKNGLPTLDRKAFPSFIKRVRNNSKQSGIKYYTVGEYGSNTLRPHYHSIIYNIPRDYLESDNLQTDWKQGHLHAGNVNLATINYTTKYLIKGTWKPEDEEDDRTPEFSIMSKNLGDNFLTPQMKKYIRENKHTHITIEDGKKINMPRYYTERIYENKNTRKVLTDANKQEKEFRSEKHKVEYRKLKQFKAAKQQSEEHNKETF